MPSLFIVQYDGNVSNGLVTLEYDSDNSYMAICAILVFAMQIGFAFLEAGLERSKNVTNMLMKTVVNSIVAALIFWACGYAFAFGNREGSSNGFIGSKHFFLTEINENDPISHETVWFFQWVFVSTASVIVSGAIAGRAYFQTYLTFSVIMCGWIYPVVAHWVFDPQGWLRPNSEHSPFPDKVGMADFAGGTVVHVVGGTAALVGAIIVGPRHNRFDRIQWDGSKTGVLSATKSLWTTLGVFLLWFGWYGFNMGSSGRISNHFSKLNGIVALNNTLACSAGALGPLLIHKIRKKNWDINITLNGILAGLASITSSCAFVAPWGAFVIGGVGGIVYYVIALLLIRLKIDDPLEASAIHIGSGAWGVIGTGLLALEERIKLVYNIEGHYGLFMGGGGILLGCQVTGIVCSFAWSGVWSLLFFWTANKLGKLRVSLDMERMGLDVAHLEMTDIQLELYKNKGNNANARSVTPPVTRNTRDSRGSRGAGDFSNDFQHTNTTNTNDCTDP